MDAGWTFCPSNPAGAPPHGIAIIPHPVGRSLHADKLKGRPEKASTEARLSDLGI
jgi:hypothetical protein